MKPQLVLLAAGLGARFGGLKQLTPVGPAGELLIDYTVGDARRAGIERLVVVLREELAGEFRALRGDRYAETFEVAYAYQPPPPEGRSRPWGTGHALLAAREVVDAPFLVANSDDYYGPRSIARLAEFLRQPAAPNQKPSRWAMVGYPLAETLSEFGPVSRSLCELDPEGLLCGLREETALTAESAEARRGALVSMNLWALRPALFAPLAAGFESFLASHAGDKRAEYFLPAAIAAEIAAGHASVQVFPAEDRWFGLTHPGDLALARARLAAESV